MVQRMSDIYNKLSGGYTPKETKVPEKKKYKYKIKSTIPSEKMFNEIMSIINSVEHVM